MSVGRTVIDEEGKIIYLDRTYVVNRERQTPILRSNNIALNPETGEPWKAGDKIKDAMFEAVADNKPQFKGWVGELEVLDSEINERVPDGTILDGLKTFTIYV